MIWLLPPPPLPWQQVVSLFLSSCVSPVEFTYGRRRGVERSQKSHDGKKAWSSVNNSILSGFIQWESTLHHFFGDRDPAEGSSHQRTNSPLSLFGSMWVSADGSWIRWFWLGWQHALLCCVRQLELVFFFSVHSGPTVSLPSTVTWKTTKIK